MNINFKNKLNDNEIKCIVNEIKNTTGIIYYSHKEINKFEVLSINDSDFIGSIFFKEHKNFIDFRIAIIKEEYRNKGYMKILLKEFLKDKNKPIYCSSRNEFMIKLLLKNKFKQIRFYNLPLKQLFTYFLSIFNLTRIKENIKKRKLDNNKFKLFKR